MGVKRAKTSKFVVDDSDNGSDDKEYKDEGEVQDAQESEISAKRRVTVRAFKGRPMVDIREFWGEDVDKPGKKVYAAKRFLDQREQKLLGQPGETYMPLTQRYPGVIRASKWGAAGAGVVGIAYWAYDKRQHRPTPAISRIPPSIAEGAPVDGTTTGTDFYSDQYADRERRYRKELAKLELEQREREALRRQRLEDEDRLMQSRLNEK
ncbi:hypothetical protein BZG36_04611 [Bifiguratus adelaidae]|uniref:Transcriptional coactivator p15 (PC4) C-terminal domain-containing protein n=1 Tax=Bifiguratus adelaidae TaxID=1938954 RepID=A0A261XXI1_9FUNG|nr:hypothetical protein BZG36_04611 [Bifiguratus adelaidae]